MSRFAHWIQAVALAMGAPGILVVAFLDSSILSLPEIADLLLIYMVTARPARFALYVSAATLGSLVGCLLLYYLGKKGGEALMRRRFNSERTDRTLAAFRRHGVMAVLVPSILPPPAPFKIFVLLAGVAWGGLALAKFSAPLFALMFVAMAAVRFTRHRRGLGHVIGGSAAALLVAVVVIWAAYGFRFDGLRSPGTYNHAWSDYGDSITVRAAALAQRLHLLPDAWLQGFAHTAHFAQGRPAFFMGEFGTKGWTLFFPMAFAAKTTLAALALLTLAAVALIGAKRTRTKFYRLAPLAILVVV